jgi:putative mRNA 3-end processing factor
MINWIVRNKENGKTSVLLAYSLGKAQRVLQHIKDTTETIYAHGAIFNTQQTLIDHGFNLAPVVRITPETPKELLKGAVVIAPPSADGTTWMKKFTPHSVGICSGWMQVRGNARRRNADAGFALSDHADWEGLLKTVKATGAERVFVTHGFQASFSRYLNEEGIALAAEVKTEYGTEDEDAGKADENETPKTHE